VTELVCSTADRDAWLAARREGITATDIGVILGLVAWDSPFALYWRKKGKLPEVEESDRMRLGSWLEDAIMQEWEGGEGWREVTGPGGLFRSTSRPWQLATPDALVRDLHDGTEDESGPVIAVLECKTSATKDGWGPGGMSQPLPEGELLDEWQGRVNQVPAHVRAQVLWQMDTLDVAVGHVAVVFLPSGEFRSYTITHDPAHVLTLTESETCDLCRDIILMRGHGLAFMDRLERELPPPVDGSPVTTGALRHLHAGAVKGKQAVIADRVARVYTEACHQVKQMEYLKRQTENQIREAMGDATLAVDPDGEVIARRDVFKNSGYTVSPFEVDRLVRVTTKEDNNGTS